jgi:hypothetical protein
MIRPPRQDGIYPDRDLDCQEAVEPAFLRHAFAGTAFVDIIRIEHDVQTEALEAGWSETEVNAALIELARCYVRQVRAMPNSLR